MAYRHDGFFYAMDTYREYQLLNELWESDAGALEGLGSERRACSGATGPTLVTGATGLVGSWLVRRLVEPAPTSSAWCATGCRRVGAGPQPARSTSQGRARRRARSGAAGAGPRRIRDRHRLPPRGADDRRHRQPQSGLDLREQHPRDVGCCSKPAAARPPVQQIVVASSDKAYGDQQTSCRTTRDTPLQGSHPYDVSKSCADLIAQTYAVTYGLPVAITRCGNFYGGGDLNWNRIVPGTIRSVLRGERP